MSKGFPVAALLAWLLAAAYYFYQYALRSAPSVMMPQLSEAFGVNAPLLCLFGSEDGGIPPADVAAIRGRLEGLAGGHQVVVYEGAKHAFFCDARPAFHPAAAQAAWNRTLAFLGLAGSPP